MTQSKNKINDLKHPVYCNALLFQWKYSLGEKIKKKNLLLTISPLHIENEKTGPHDGDVLSEQEIRYFN